MVQILLIIFIVLIIARISDRYWRKEIHSVGFFSWLAFWLSAGAVVLWPDSSSWLATVLGVGRGVDLMLYLSVMLIFYLLFRIFVRLEKQEKEITKLVRKMALDESRKEGGE